MDNPESWEGWHWGATHAWGYYWKLGVTDNFDMLEDALKHTEQLIFWGVDPNTSSGGYNGPDSDRWRLWCKELGIKMIFIDPWCNFTAATWGDKWIAPRPGTDAALAEAIAYVWIKDDTYDHWFVENKTLGFEEFKAQTLGEKDGVPGLRHGRQRSARFRKGISGLWPAMGIKTDHDCQRLTSGLSGACRQPYGTVWARMTD